MTRTKRAEMARRWCDSPRFRPGAWSDSLHLNRSKWRDSPQSLEKIWGTRAQARERRRNTEYPPQARPARAMHVVEGSGTVAT